MPDRASLLHPRGLPQVPAHLAAGTGAGYRRLSGGCPDHTFWRLGFRQSSFRHITRIPRRTAPYAWARSPVSWPAIFPTHLSAHGSAIRSKDTSSSPCPLRGRYSSAPRGARKFRASWTTHDWTGCSAAPSIRIRRVLCSITAKILWNAPPSQSTESMFGGNPRRWRLRPSCGLFTAGSGADPPGAYHHDPGVRLAR